jgi:hypothetical protein
MRWNAVLLGPTLMAIVLGPLPSRAGTGGPDRAGYSWLDSDEAGLGYSWVDISSVGTRVSLGDDEETVRLPIGFEFEFYDGRYDDLRIGSNGYVTFNDRNWGIFTDQEALPDLSDPNHAIYGFYRDLDPTEDTSGEIYYATIGEAPERQFVVTYDQIDVNRDIPGPFDDPSDPVSVQIILYEGSNAIEVNVQDTFTPPATVTGWVTLIGIENADGTDGLGFTRDVIPAQFTVRFERNDGLQLWPRAQTVTGTVGEPTSIELELENLTQSELTVSLQAESSSGWSATVSVESLTLPPQASDSFSLEVRDPTVDIAGAPADDWSDAVTLTATWDGGALTATAEIGLAFPGDGWERLAPLPEPVGGLQAVTDGHYLYVLGGRRLSSEPSAKTWRWDPATDTWDDEAIADLPLAVWFGGACYVDGRIYYVGGTGVNEAFNPGLLIYDLGTDTWSAGARPPVALAGSPMACAGGKVYVLGGWADLDDDLVFAPPVLGCARPPSPDADCSPPECCWDWPEAATRIYDIESDSWSEGPAPPTGYIGGAAAAIDGEILLGGMTYPVDGEQGTVMLASYDLSTETWTPLAAPATPLVATAGTFFNGLMCFLSNSDVEDRMWSCYSEGLWIRQWDELLGEHVMGAAVALDGQLYAVGGWALALDEEAGSVERWTASDPVPPPPDDEPEPVLEPTSDAGASESGGEDAGGCGCGLVASRASLPGPLALLSAAAALALIRRRARRAVGAAGCGRRPSGQRPTASA